MSKKSDKIMMFVFITLVVIILIIYIGFKINTKENFGTIDKISVDSNFYDLTQSNGNVTSVFSKVPDTNAPNNKIGGNNLCIYKTDNNNTKVTDIECISSDEFRIARNIPNFRKKNVCIDEECIGIDDVLFLLGKRHFKLGNLAHKKPNRLNWTNTPVMKYFSMPALTCSGFPIVSGINTLGYGKPGDKNTDFILEPSPFTIDMAEDNVPKFKRPPTTDNGLGGIFRKAPSHQ